MGRLPTGDPKGGDSPPRGTVVLAAYKPPVDLFEIQLKSIQRQTVRDFECLISADGDAGYVRSLVQEAVGDDPRFRVIGYDERLGFYANFERALSAVDLNSRWVALSDQDDRWYPHKLEQLIPCLSQYSLVASQSRVVRSGGSPVVLGATRRKDTHPEYFFIENQYTGGTCVFRRELLDLALPFPKLNTASQVHDHWLAVCAAASEGSKVTNWMLQDYVQHGQNAIGEAERGFSPSKSIVNARKLARKYEGSDDVAALARTIYRVGVGWRETMALALAERIPGSSFAQSLLKDYGPQRNSVRTGALVIRGVLSGQVHMRAAAEYLAGLLVMPLARLQKSPR